MIEYGYGVYVPVCDGCGEELPDEFDFQDAVEAMKREHWLFVRPEGYFGLWDHYCPECARRMRKQVFDE